MVGFLCKVQAQAGCTWTQVDRNLGSLLHLTLKIKDRPKGDWLEPEALLLLVSPAMAWMAQAVKRVSSSRLGKSHTCVKD